MKKCILIGSFLLLLSWSCNDDFLDNPPLGVVNEDSFITSEEDAILATNAIYNTLRIWFFHTGGFPIFDIMSDDAVKGSNPGDAINILAYDNFTFTPDEGSVLRYYTTLYQGIRRANTVIERVPGVADIDPELQERLVAEARFLRGYFYFNLVQAYGDVPLVTTTNPPLQLPKSAKEDIYQEVIFPDLEFAAQTLPEKSDYAAESLGRATRGAAKALLARIYLFRNDFVNAERFALEVIQSGEYSLDPDYIHTFSVDGEFGSGSIFEIGALPEENTDLGGNQFGNTQGIRGTPNRGWGFNRPSYDLITYLTTEDDPRLEGTVIFLGDTIDGTVIIGDSSTPDTTYTGGSISQIETYNRKVYTPGSTAAESWGYNVRLIRYADVLLMAAEALNENGKSAEALIYLNRVRERARAEDAEALPDITTTNQAELRSIIYEERRRELALEGLRFFDLVRTGRAAEVLGPLGFIEGKHETLPLPQSEIDLSQGILIQNPPW